MARQRIEAPIKGVTARQHKGVITPLDEEDQPKLYSKKELTKMTKPKLSRIVSDMGGKTTSKTTSDEMIVMILESQKDPEATTKPEGEGQGGSDGEGDGDGEGDEGKEDDEGKEGDEDQK